MTRQIDPSGPYMTGYQHAELGFPPMVYGYLTSAERREYKHGYHAAEQERKAP